MTEPSAKSPQMEEFLNNTFGGVRNSSIRANMCVSKPIGCGMPATQFRDKLSEKEYTISGWCQDRFYGE